MNRKYCRTPGLVFGSLLLSVACGCSVLKGGKPVESEPAWHKDAYRPQYHYSAKKNWANDPNGLIYYEEEWHLFYQYNPYGNFDGHKHWAHAVSSDLVHWEDLPLALFPDSLGDCWSGSVVADKQNTSGLFTGNTDEYGKKKEEGLVAIYTSFSETICQSLAYSVDRGRTWTKYEGNPVVASSNNPGGSIYFRDPKVFWHEESSQWMMVISGGPLMIYTSPDLLHWECGIVDTEIQTECPDLFPITVDGTAEKKWVLTLSGQFYLVGELKKMRNNKWMFRPETEKIPMNFGPDCYATQSWNSAPNGSVYTISWLISPDYITSLPTILPNYSGLYSLVYELSLIKEEGGYRLLQNPLKAYEQLRQNQLAVRKEYVLEAGQENAARIPEVQGKQYELLVEFFPNPSVTEFGIKLYLGEEEETVLSYQPASGQLSVDRSRSGVFPADAFGNPGVYSTSLSAEADGGITLRIFADESILEVFAGQGQVLGTFLVFPQEKSNGVSFYAEGGKCPMKMEFVPLSSRW